MHSLWVSDFPNWMERYRLVCHLGKVMGRIKLKDPFKKFEVAIRCTIGGVNGLLEM